MTPLTVTAAEQRAGVRIPWGAFVWFSALLLLCYAPTLAALVRQWSVDEDVGHGFFVPLLAGYIAWQKRAELAALKPEPNWWGLALVLWAGLQLLVATLGAEIFLARTAFVLSVIGSVWFLGGSARLRTLALPLFLLFFMIPIPAIIYSQVTFPLQRLASRAAEFSLLAIGIPVLREGNVLELAGEKLSVVEACSGIRSLLSLSFLSLVYGYFFERRTWLRVVLFLATAPVAMLANAARVTLTGVLAEYQPQLAHGFFHTVEGWVMFLLALVMLTLFHQVVLRVAQVIDGKR